MTDALDHFDPLVDSRENRDRHAGRTEVLDRVKALTLAPGDLVATLEMAAAYYEVTVTAIEETIRRNRDELMADGMEVLTGQRLSVFKTESRLQTRAASLTVLPRRAILRAGMLLRDSPVARRVRDYLLGAADADLSSASGVLALAERYLASARQLVAAETKIKELEPKAAAHDTYMTAEGGRLVREVAKMLGLRENELRAFLVEERILFSRFGPGGKTVWDVYAQYAGHFKPVAQTYQRSSGTVATYTLNVLPSGVELIRRRLDRRRRQLNVQIDRATTGESA